MKNEKLTTIQAFKAMQKFLEKYYEQTNSSDIGLLLGEIQLIKDGETMDPAAWEDWIESIQEILNRH